MREKRGKSLFGGGFLPFLVFTRNEIFGSVVALVAQHGARAEAAGDGAEPGVAAPGELLGGRARNAEGPRMVGRSAQSAGQRIHSHTVLAVLFKGIKGEVEDEEEVVFRRREAQVQFNQNQVQSKPMKDNKQTASKSIHSAIIKINTTEP